MSKIYYASCTCSSSTYRKLFENASLMPGQQVQKYHRLFAKGFSKNKCNVEMVTVLPITRSNYASKVVRGWSQTEEGIDYKYVSLINFPGIKQALGSINVCITIVKDCLFDRKNKYIICDVLNQSASIGAIAASKLLGLDCIGIVTDLPEMIYNSKITKRINNIIISACNKYVFMTEAMSDKIDCRNKEYIVLEGHTDLDIGTVDVAKSDTKFICLYSGALCEKYGLKYLVNGFLNANLPNAELHIYGNGEYEKELSQVCEKNPAVKYFGVKLNDYIIKAQAEASLLINPRPSSEEFTKYSFPSKNMEYMLSGTPVLTTKLPGMPKEYYPYVFFIENETAEGISKCITDIYNMKLDELNNIGLSAREFVLKNKTCVAQVKKLKEKFCID